MNKTTALRTAAGLFTIVLTLTSASCGLFRSEKKKTSTKPADEVMDHSYNAVRIDCELPMQSVDSLYRLGDSGNYLISGRDGGESVMYITDSGFSDFSKVEVSVEAGRNSEYYVRASAAPDGSFFVLASITDYGDHEIPDWNDPDFDYDSFDFEAFNQAAETSYSLAVYDSDGSLLTQSEVQELQRFSDDDGQRGVYLGSMFPCDRDNVIIAVSSEMDHYALYGSDGRFVKEIDFGDDVWLSNYCIDNNGDLAFLTWEDGGDAVRTFDAEALEMKKDSLPLRSLEGESNISNIISGNEEYSYFLSGSMWLFGVSSDGSCQGLVNWTDSDLISDHIISVISAENGEFIIAYEGTNVGSTGLYRLTKRDPSEFADKTVVTVAVVSSDPDFTAAVTDLNNSGGSYRIRVSDYSEYYEWDEENRTAINTPENQLKLDIISGKSPDMIYFSASSELKALASKDAFADLYDFLDSDSELSRDDIVDPLLKACESDGKLVFLAPTFGVNTLAVKSKLWDKQSWTLDELISVYDSLPEGTYLSPYRNSNISVFSTLYQNLHFVDFEKGTCSFDSPEFIKLMEFSNRFPEEINWELATDEDVNDYFSDKEYFLRDEKALLNTFSLSDIREYNTQKYADFGEDITLAGFPSTDGKGAELYIDKGFAIMKDSTSKDVCWELIRSFFTEEHQSNIATWEIPASKAAFEKKLEEAKSDPYYFDENGKKVSYPNIYYLNNEEISIPNLTDEDVDMIRDYIYNSTSTAATYYGDDIYNIVYEEVSAYFKGERSAKDAADIIQNRVSIMVSEQS